MTIDELIEYCKNTPENLNPTVLKGLIERVRDTNAAPERKGFYSHWYNENGEIIKIGLLPNNFVVPTSFYENNINGIGFIEANTNSSFNSPIIFTQLATLGEPETSVGLFIVDDLTSYTMTTSSGYTLLFDTGAELDTNFIYAKNYFDFEQFTDVDLKNVFEHQLLIQGNKELRYTTATLTVGNHSLSFNLATTVGGIR